MRFYLITFLLIIMGAGARTMFEIAHHALGREHDFAPADDTIRLIFLALWFVLMMVADVVLLRHPEIKNRTIFVALLSVGVIVPVVYKFISN